MERKLLEIGKELQNNCEYYVEGDRFDVYLDDTVYATNDTYACCRSRNKLKNVTNEMNVAFLLKGKENVVLDFCGATLFLHGEIQPFIFDGCKNVTIKNCIVEYDRSYVTEAEIVESTSEYLKVKVFDKFPYRIEDGDFIITSETWENHNLDKTPMFFQLFDKKTRKGKGALRAVIGKNPQIGNKPYDRGAFKLYAREENGFVFLEGENLPVLSEDLILVIAHADRKYSSLMTVNCENVYIENYRILNGAGMGILPMYTKNIYIDGLKMCYDERSHGIISNEADAIHTFACSGDFVIKNSVIEGMIDDALNIHGNFYKVKSCGKTTITGISPGADNDDVKAFGIGDTIRVYEGSTMKKTQDYKILAIRNVNGAEVEFTVDKEVLQHQKGDTIENLSAQSNLTISNCRFGKGNTHLRFQTRGDILIENCETELPFWLTGDMSFWFESSPVLHMTVMNTKFKTEHAVFYSCPEFIPTEEAPYYHENLAVRNCSFENAIPLRANYMKNVIFEGNTNVNGKEMKLVLKNCGECVSDCEIERIYEEKKVLGLN